jgi:uncharacterized membrane protein
MGNIMIFLLLGLIIFVAIHSLPMFPQWRSALIERVGLVIYRSMHSVGAVLGLALIAYGFAAYRASGLIPMWSPPLFLRHITLLLMLFAFIFMASAYSPLGYIKTRLKHPMLMSVKTWAVAHLLANGDVGGMVLFTTLLIWAVVDVISFRWRPVVKPDQSPALLGDVIAVLAGSLAYAGMVFAHPYLIGVSVMG